jgi:hypothetical protein
VAKTKEKQTTENDAFEPGESDADAEGNVQDLSVHDLNDPNVAPTFEAQDAIAERPPIVVPMPAHTDPENPLAAAGSINMALEQHPVEHSPDFGATIEQRDGVTSAVDAHATETREMLNVETGGSGGAPSEDSELRATDWKKQVEAAETTEELQDVRERYNASDADYKTVDDAFGKRAEALENDQRRNADEGRDVPPNNANANDDQS